MQKIELPTIAEILDEEFMQPYGISAYRLAKDISVPVSRIQDILHGRRKISVDTALGLSKYFGLSESYFLDLQNEIELRKSKISAQPKLIDSCVYDFGGFVSAGVLDTKSDFIIVPCTRYIIAFCARVRL